MAVFENNFYKIWLSWLKYVLVDRLTSILYTEYHKIVWLSLLYSLESWQKLLSSVDSNINVKEIKENKVSKIVIFRR